MAINTYVALDTKTLASTATSVVFTSIPQTYTDLIIVFSGTVGTLDNNNITFNGDTGSNYSTGRITGTNSAGTTSRGSNLSAIQCGEIGTFESSDIIHVQNYSNTTTNKMVLHRSGNTSQFLKFSLGMWRNTAAITSITITNGGVFTVGSTFTMYGIASSNIGAPKAFGGTITQDATYTYHTFGASGAFVPQQSLTCDYIVVAGGGGAGGGNSFGGTGGGGAGGYRAFTAQSLTGGTSYSVTVGAGGNGGAAPGSGGGTNGSNGVDSTFNSHTATGGGAGTTTNGASGGSGGGAYGYPDLTYSGGAGNTPSTSPSQGYNGGLGKSDNVVYTHSGGGGGAGQVGGNATTTRGGLGGNGIASSINGILTYYAGGGGGGAASNVGTSNAAGGLGGGGTGKYLSGSAGDAGTPNTGGGGGGSAGGSSVAGGNGGSGVVIIRYAN